MAKSKSPSIPSEIAALSFEQALSELETIVEKLEAGDVDLEQSNAFYERGTLLKAHCEAKLTAAKAKVEKITLSADGSISTEPADVS